MLALLAIIEFLYLCIHRFLDSMRISHRPHCRCARIAPIDKRNHHYSQQKPEWLKREIIQLKACMPKAGCRTIADICNRRFAAARKVTVGKTFVHETLQRHEYEIQILRRKLKHAKPKAVPRNLIWGLDLTGKSDVRGKLHYLLGIIDHGSRAMLHLQALHDKTSRTLIACIDEVTRTYGKPRIIRTDCGRVAAQQRGTHRRTPCGCNEAIFTSRIFRRGLKLLGIRHQLTDPGCPWQNGRIERLFGTLKDKLDQWAVAGIEQLNCDLNTFQQWYNHVRPHQNLEGRTPSEAWHGINPYTKPSKQEQWFEAWDGLLTGYHLRY
jgi:transposase InsO family protein